MTQEQLSFTDVTVERDIDMRPYQNQFVEAVEKAWGDSHEAVLGVLPTGAGKTATAGELVAQVIEGKSPIHKSGRVLWLAHTRGLVNQGQKALHRLYGMEGGFEMGAISADGNPLVFGTIQTANNRIAKRVFPRDYWDLIVVDEAHRVLSETYQRCTNYYTCPVLGITATPRRGDQQDLMEFFDTKAIDIPLSELIDQGYLCKLTIINCPLQIDLTKVKAKAGDFDETELAHAIEPYLGACGEELAKFKGRKMLVFLPLISTSLKFRESAADAGLDFMHLDGNSQDRHIEVALDNLQGGHIDGICNSMLLTEGIDMPKVDLIMNLRPTKSWTLYTQIMGRGTRNAPGKDDCIILDPLRITMKETKETDRETVPRQEALDLCTKNYHEGNGKKVPVDEEFYDEFLNVLPPIYFTGGFAVSEPYTHNAKGMPVFLCIEGRPHNARAFYWTSPQLARDYIT